MTRPEHHGAWHWLEAEHLLAAVADASSHTQQTFLVAMAAVHAQLAASAPAYGWHQEPRAVVADSPNITPGKDEAPVPYRGPCACTWIDGRVAPCRAHAPGGTP